MDRDTKMLLKLQDQKESDDKLFIKVKKLASKIKKFSCDLRHKEINAIRIVGLIKKRKEF